MSLTIIPRELTNSVMSMMLDSPDMLIIINIEDTEYLNDSGTFFGEVDVSEVLNMEPGLRLENFSDMDILISPNNVSEMENAINSNHVTDMENVINNISDMGTLYNPFNDINFTDIDLSFINLMDLLFQRYLSENDEVEENIYLQYEIPVALMNLLQSLRNVPENRPVPEDVVNNLPVIKMNENQLKKYEKCPICLENFKLEEKAVLLPCNHSYHEICLRSWFKQQNHCPFCRQEI